MQAPVPGFWPVAVTRLRCHAPGRTARSGVQIVACASAPCVQQGRIALQTVAPMTLVRVTRVPATPRFQRVTASQGLFPAG